uniref:Glutamyl-tRNA(Gln) amidotransferase subunit B, mitochondrial n=1 Tax=Parastrongyloides trichosuri TaxID=131310 RepID=A0A0N4ZKM3_PARTI
MLNKFRVNIGLEIHAQLASRTKLFSSAPVLENAPPNTLVNIFDCGIPGTMPVLNKNCVMMAIKAAKILNCEIPHISRFDRKHYFYPDMPMGFQITQQEMPIAKNGFFDFYICSPIYSSTDQSNNSSENRNNNKAAQCRIPIKQVQLEIDSGKTIIDGKKQCLIDLNRAGIGLIEIVTLPTISSSLEAVSFLEQLRLFLIHNNITKGEMHKGHFRVDANISLIDKEAPLDVYGERTEVKNINSFKDIVKAIDYEIGRHKDMLIKGKKIRYETRRICENGKTEILREKEGEFIDYRFTAEPNLPLLRINQKWLDSNETSVRLDDLPHLVYINKYGITPKEALELTNDIESKKFMDIALSINEIPVRNFLDWYRELKLLCNKIKKYYPLKNEIDIQNFCFVINLEYSEKITKLSAVDLLKNILTNSDNIKKKEIMTIIDKENLWRINNVEEINKYVDEVCEKEKGLYNKLKNTRNVRDFNKLRNKILQESNKRIVINDIENCIWKKINLQ